MSMLHCREFHITIAVCMVSIKDFSSSAHPVFRTSFFPSKENPGNVGMGNYVTR